MSKNRKPSNRSIIAAVLKCRKSDISRALSSFNGIDLSEVKVYWKPRDAGVGADPEAPEVLYTIGIENTLALQEWTWEPLAMLHGQQIYSAIDSHCPAIRDSDQFESADDLWDQASLIVGTGPAFKVLKKTSEGVDAMRIYLTEGDVAKEAESGIVVWITPQASGRPNRQRARILSYENPTPHHSGTGFLVVTFLGDPVKGTFNVATGGICGIELTEDFTLYL